MMRNRVNFFALSIFEGQPLNSCVLNVAHLAVKDKRSPPGSFQDRFCSDYEKQVSKIGSVNTWILNLYCVFWITEIRMEDERGHTRSRDSQQSSEHCKCKDSMWKCTAETVVTVKQITPEQLSEKNKSFIQIMLYPHTFTSSFQKKKKSVRVAFVSHSLFCLGHVSLTARARSVCDVALHPNDGVSLVNLVWWMSGHGASLATVSFQQQCTRFPLTFSMILL